MSYNLCSGTKSYRSRRRTITGSPSEGVRYDPASDFWPPQWYETGIYVALAGVLAGLCFWRIRGRRD